MTRKTKPKPQQIRELDPRTLQQAIQKGQAAARHDAKKGAAGAREAERMTAGSLARLKALFGLK